MSKRKPQILKGFRDYLPQDMLLRQQVISTFRTVFERHGYEPLDTPALEYLEILTGKAGENEKLMYHFLDQGNREIGLRYDLTVPLSRFVAMHQNDVVMPFKRYHIAPVWRAEKPQRGRFREFWQCDADIVGAASMQADAESISVLVDALHGVNLGRAVVHINHRKLLEALAVLAGVPAGSAPVVYRAIDKLAKIGPDGVKAELMKQEVSETSANRIIELVTTQGTTETLIDAAETQLAGIPGGPEAVTELRDLFQFIEDLGVPRNAYTLDLSLARGIDYYTGPVYEAIVEEPKVGSVAGAGRYDGLIGMFTGRDIPATGMSLGMERIIEVIREFDLLPVNQSVAEIFVACSAETLADASHITRILRTHGINADLSLLTHRSLGEQLRYADRRQIRFAVIAGSAEVDQGTIAIKNLRTGEQHAFQASLLVEEVRRLIQA